MFTTGTEHLTAAIAAAIAAAASLMVRKGPGLGLAPKWRSTMPCRYPHAHPGLGSASI